MKQFEEPEICIIQFDIEDIITVSSGEDTLNPITGPGGLPIITK